jgi:hypothetical protein
LNVFNVGGERERGERSLTTRREKGRLADVKEKKRKRKGERGRN